MREDGLSFGLSVNRWFKLRTAYQKMVQTSRCLPKDGSSFGRNDYKTAGHFFQKVERRTIFGKGRGCGNELAQ